jgi:hypothetical protein
MRTWVLAVTLFTGDSSVETVSIPGLTKADCRRALERLRVNKSARGSAYCFDAMDALAGRGPAGPWRTFDSPR